MDNVTKAIVSAAVSNEAENNTFELLKGSAIGHKTKEDWHAHLEPFEIAWLEEYIPEEELYTKKGNIKKSKLPNRYQSPKSNIGKLFELGVSPEDMQAMSRSDMAKYIRENGKDKTIDKIISDNYAKLKSSINQYHDPNACAEQIVQWIKKDFNI